MRRHKVDAVAIRHLWLDIQVMFGVLKVCCALRCEKLEEKWVKREEKDIVLSDSTRTLGERSVEY